MCLLRWLFGWHWNGPSRALSVEGRNLGASGNTNATLVGGRAASLSYHTCGGEARGAWAVSIKIQGSMPRLEFMREFPQFGLLLTGWAHLPAGAEARNDGGAVADDDVNTQHSQEEGRMAACVCRGACVVASVSLGFTSRTY